MKIVIIGNGGTGKSTLGDRLSKELGIPITHLDKLSWKDNWHRVPEDDFSVSLQKVMEQKAMIIEGWAYQSTMKDRLRWADIIIYLQYPLEYCLSTVFKRNEEYNNRDYPYDLFTGNRVAHNYLYREALERVYYQNEPIVQQWLSSGEFTDKEIFVFTSIGHLNDSYNGLVSFLRSLVGENF